MVDRPQVGQRVSVDVSPFIPIPPSVATVMVVPVAGLLVMVVIPTARRAEHGTKNDCQPENGEEQRQQRPGEWFEIPPQHGSQRMTGRHGNDSQQGRPAEEVWTTAKPTPQGNEEK
jgi:hypothetical protein